MKKMIALLLMMLVGCASLSIPTPQTAAQRFAAAVAINACVRTQAATQRAAGVISRGAAESVLEKTDLVRGSAEMAYAGMGATDGGVAQVIAIEAMGAIQTMKIHRQVNSMIAEAQAAEVDLTPEQVDAVRALDDEARGSLVGALR